MSKRAFLPLVAWIAMGSLAAQSLSDRGVIPLDSPVYRLLDAVYLERGLARPEPARPWTRGQAERILGRVAGGDLSMAGRRALERVRDELGPPPAAGGSSFAFGFKPVLDPEFYVHAALGGDAGATAENYQWTHGYEARPPLLQLPFEMAFGTDVWLFTDFAVKEEHDTVDSHTLAGGGFPSGVTGNWSNLVFDDPNPRPDLYAPFRAIASIGGDAWNARLGRDRLSWGNGHTGNFLLSDWPDWYDSIDFSFFSENFTFTSVFASMDAFMADRTPLGFSGLAAHRLDFRVLGRASISVSESVSLSGTPDLVRDTNFMMVFHDWMIPERANSLLTLEASYNPWKYFSVYAQGAMDEFETAYEAAGNGGGGPGIFGFLGGVESSVPLGDGYLNANLEYAITSPWLYNRRAAPHYYDVRRYWSLTTNEFEYIVKPIGYRYGPDTVLLAASAGYEIPGGLRGGIDVSWIRQGEKTLESDWAPAPGDMPLDGVVEGRVIVHGAVEVPVFRWLSVGTDCNAAFVTNRDHVEGQWRNDLELTVHARVTMP